MLLLPPPHCPTSWTQRRRLRTCSDGDGDAITAVPVGFRRGHAQREPACILHVGMYTVYAADSPLACTVHNTDMTCVTRSRSRALTHRHLPHETSAATKCDQGWREHTIISTSLGLFQGVPWTTASQNSATNPLDRPNLSDTCSSSCRHFHLRGAFPRLQIRDADSSLDQ